MKPQAKHVPAAPVQFAVFAVLFLSYLFFAVCFTASAAQAETADLPEAVLRALAADGLEADSYIVQTLPDGRRYAAVWSRWDWLYGFLEDDGPAGEWKLRMQVSPMLEDARLEAVPGDGIAFRLTNGKQSITRRWNGEDFSVCGWSGGGYSAVLADGVITYTDANGREEAVVCPSQLPMWMSTYPSLPLTPADAELLQTVSPETAETLLPGWTLCGYESGDEGRSADASYARLTDGCLRLARAHLTAEARGIAQTTETIAVPVSASFLRAANKEPLKELIRADSGSSTFLFPADALDTARVPVRGTVTDSELQRDLLVLLTEEADGRHLAVVTGNEKDGWSVQTSAVLPKDTSMYTFHNSEGEIILSWNGQEMEACWTRNTDGTWTARWGMTASSVWSAEWGRVIWSGPEGETTLFGMPELPDLMRGDLSLMPETPDGMRAMIDPRKWAAVANPDPNDRLHLRAKPERGAASLGKFWNGTPVRLLETKGDWCRVQIGANGILTGWMMKRYLAFGSAASGIADAAPQLSAREGYEKSLLLRSAGGKEQTQISLDGSFRVIGITQDGSYYIVMDTAGGAGYAPQEWLWEGNG